SVLRAIAGLARPDGGRVELDGETWVDVERGMYLSPERRRVGLVFQEYALFPHLSVRQNVAFGGKERVDDLLERFRLTKLTTARPADPFAASFTGANLLRGHAELLEDGLTSVRLGTGDVVYSTDRARGEVGVVVYPWDVSVGRVHVDGSALNLVAGEVTSVVPV